MNLKPVGLLIARYASNMAVSCLPSRYRRWWKYNDTDDLRRGASLCGLIQGNVCLALLVVSFVNAGNLWVNPPKSDPIAQELINRIGDRPGEIHTEGELALGMGQFFLYDFIFKPLNAAYFFFWLEGWVRAVGGYTGQSLATTPLYAIAGVHTGLERLHYRWSLGPRIHDEIFPGDGKTYDMKVLSCRPKKAWSRYITVRFREEFYQMTQQESGPPPRPFVYYLRKNPIGRLVVFIEEYDPIDVLKEG